MRSIGLVFALCVSLGALAVAPLEAATRNPSAVGSKRVKAKKNKVNGRKAPKVRKRRAPARTN